MVIRAPLIYILLAAAVQVVSYLQMQDPPMLPPLASLVYSDVQRSVPRLLAPSSNIDLKEALHIAAQRCRAARTEFAVVPGPKSLLELFSGFVDYMRDICEESLEEPQMWVGLHSDALTGWHSRQSTLNLVSGPSP